MKSTLQVRTIDATYKDIFRSRIMLVHKLQRKEGQWSNKQKADLIDSIFRNIPLNPTYMIEEKAEIDYGLNGKKKILCNFAIDGVQRLSTIRDYVAGKFKIPKSYSNMLPPIIIDGDEIDINGKNFKQLDEWVREYFMARELQMYIISDFSDEEVREMFKRQNAGSPLTNAQKNVVLLSDGLRDEIDSISMHKFWKKCKLSSNDFKKDAIRNVILQCMWAISDWDECPITDFLSKENGGVYRDFVPWIEKDQKYIGTCEELLDCLNELNNCIPDSRNEALTKATISAVIYGMYCAIKNGRILDRYKVMINNFISHYYEDDWAWYRYELTDGTYQHKKVIDRLNVFKQLSDNAASINYTELRRKQYEEFLKGLTEITTDDGKTAYLIDETEEDRIAREIGNKLDEEISDSELDEIGKNVAKNMGLL